MKITIPLISETYDIFDVRQVTRATTLESTVAVDLVHVAPHKDSQTHRHNKADTVLLILDGSGEVRVGQTVLAVSKGDRIHIPPGAFHKVTTRQSSMEFLSVQSPPILTEDDHLDLELELKESA